MSKTSKVIEGHKSLSNFRVNPTLPMLDGPLMLPHPNCVVISFSLSHSPSRFLFMKWSMILKVTWGHFYVAWFLKILRSFDEITTLTYVLIDNFCPCLDFLHKMGEMWYPFLYLWNSNNRYSVYNISYTILQIPMHFTYIHIIF